MTLNSIDSPGADTDTTKEDIIFQVLQVLVHLKKMQFSEKLLLADFGTTKQDTFFWQVNYH